MRARLLALAAVATAALWVGVAVAAGGAPVLSYHWQQPGTAPVTTAHAQPSFSIQTVAGSQYAASSSYVWVQPRSAVPHGVSAALH